jgi:hypothetical protein
MFLGDQLDQTLGANHRANDVDAVVPRQRLQRCLPRIGLVDPKRAVAGPVGRDHQDPGVTEMVGQDREKLLRDLIDPMEILEHEDQGARATGPDAEPAENFESFVFDRLGVRRRG